MREFQFALIPKDKTKTCPMYGARPVTYLPTSLEIKAQAIAKKLKEFVFTSPISSVEYVVESGSIVEKRSRKPTHAVG